MLQPTLWMRTVSPQAAAAAAARHNRIYHTIFGPCLHRHLSSHRGWKLNYIFNTHHHWDHTGGNEQLKAQHNLQVGPQLHVGVAEAVTSLELVAMTGFS